MLYPKPLFDVQIDLTLFNLLLLRLRLLTLLCASIWLFIAISMSKFHFPLAIEHVSARWAWNISHPLQMGKLIFYSDRILVFYFDETFFLCEFLFIYFRGTIISEDYILNGIKSIFGEIWSFLRNFVRCANHFFEFRMDSSTWAGIAFGSSPHWRILTASSNK